MKKYYKTSLPVDSEGKVRIACPFCKHEFKINAAIVKNENLELTEKVSCPRCKRELIQVYPPTEVLTKIAEDVKKEITEEIDKMFRDLERESGGAIRYKK